MSLALTGRTFFDLWAWWDCLSKSELIKLSWFSAQPSMNLPSSRYPNQNVFRIQIRKLKEKIVKNFNASIIAMSFSIQFFNHYQKSSLKKLLKCFLLKIYLYLKVINLNFILIFQPIQKL